MATPHFHAVLHFVLQSFRLPLCKNPHTCYSTSAAKSGLRPRETERTATRRTTHGMAHRKTDAPADAQPLRSLYVRRHRQHLHIAYARRDEADRRGSSEHVIL